MHSSWWKLPLSVALALLCLYFAFKGTDWKGFAQGLSLCSWWWVAASVAIGWAGFVIRGARWRIVMLPLNREISLRESYDGYTIAYLSNFALPRIGEFVRCGVIGATGKASFEAVLGTVILERSWDLLSLGIVLLLVCSLQWQRFGDFLSSLLPDTFSLSPMIIAVAVGLVLLALLCVIFVCRRCEGPAQNRAAGRIISAFLSLRDGIVMGLKMPRKWEFLLWKLLLWLSYFFTAWCGIKAFAGPHFPEMNALGFGDAIFLSVVGSLGWLVPVPGGIGAYHYIVALALSSIYGIAWDSGLLFATVSHEAQALAMILAGTLSVLFIQLKKIKTKQI